MKNFFAIIGSLLILIGCSDDKTVDQYQREKLQENLSMYQAVAGKYTGRVMSAQDGSQIGAMEVELSAEIQANPSGGGDTSVGSPMLVTNIRFLNKNTVSLSAYNSFYDPATGSFSAQIRVTRSESDAQEVISLTGNLASNQLIGEINSVEYSEYGGRFALSRNGKNLADLVPKTSPDNYEEGQGPQRIKTFIGSTSFSNGSKKPVQVVVLQPLHGTSEDILDLLTPIKNVHVSFNYSQSLHILYPGSIMDLKQGLLTGKTSVMINGRNQEITLECHTSPTQAMYCNHLTSGAGVAATTEAEYMAKPPSSLPKDPTGHTAITKVFNGTGSFTLGPGPIAMKVTQPSQGQMNDLLDLFFPNAEKPVNISLDFGKGVTVSFMDIKWDSLNGIVDGSFVGQGMGGFTAYLQCSNFYFTGSSSAFQCNYWTSRSAKIPISFEPPF
jgi:hypothetical protein